MRKTVAFGFVGTVLDYACVGWSCFEVPILSRE